MIRQSNGRASRGNVMVEMALVFVPMMLTIFGTFEVARGMWMYHTLNSAVKTGARYAVVHGENCASANSACISTVGSIVNSIRGSGFGLDPSQLQLSLSADGSAYNCTSLAICLNDGTQWPPVAHNAAGIPITIQGTYHFRSIVSSFWPGQSSASIDYVAAATEVIQF